MSLSSFLTKAGAFIQRDFRIARSYQLNFFLTSFNSLFLLAMLSFIGGMVSPDTPGVGGNYLAFVLVGYGFYQFFQLALTAFSGVVMMEQMSGRLEAIVATRTEPGLSVILSSVYGYLYALGQLVLIFVVGGLFLGVDLSRADVAATVLAFLLSTLLFTSFGILSAGFIIVLKKGDPLGWVILTLNFVFGGAFFPLERMPDWIRPLADFVPATYALNALRASILRGEGISELAYPLTVLALATAVLLPLSLKVFDLAVRKAKKEGSLVLY